MVSIMAETFGQLGILPLQTSQLFIFHQMDP